MYNDSEVSPRGMSYAAERRRVYILRCSFLVLCGEWRYRKRERPVGRSLQAWVYVRQSSVDRQHTRPEQGWPSQDDSYGVLAMHRNTSSRF